jgi:hypothetical protein
MTLEQYSYLGEIIAAIAVVASLIYLALQVRESKTSAERDASFEMIRSFQTAQFSKMLTHSYDLPPGLTRKELENKFKDDMPAFLSYMATWESLGILVHRGQISLDLVCDFFGHPLLAAWDMAETYVKERRAQAGRDTPWEWFQWLVDRVKLVELSEKPIPAYIEHDSWRP